MLGMWNPLPQEVDEAINLYFQKENGKALDSVCLSAWSLPRSPGVCLRGVCHVHPVSVCMESATFTRCLCGFPPGAPVSSQRPEGVQVRWIGRVTWIGVVVVWLG